MGEGRYWDHRTCGWVASPCAPDALVTPWSAHGLTVARPATPKDAADLLRLRGSGPLPAQRPAQAPAVAPLDAPR